MASRLKVNTANAHPTDIFSIAPTPTTLITASGSSTIRIFSTVPSRDSSDGTGGQALDEGINAGSGSDPFPLVKSLERVHKIGCHHVTASQDGKRLVSVGFGGEVKIWDCESGDGVNWLEREGAKFGGGGDKKQKAGEVWAVALNADGRYLASSSADGRVSVWDLEAKDDTGTGAVFRAREYETKGSFGMSVDISSDGRLTASGHENGSIYVFNNDSGRLAHSLPGLTLPIRAVRFSPHTTLLAAAGSSRIISLYSPTSGEQITTMSGHSSWILSLDFSSTGEWLLSTAFDGKAKVWSMQGRNCVATHGDGSAGSGGGQDGKPLWCGRWLSRARGTGNVRAEMFAVAGAGRAVSFYREASGG